MKGFKPKRRINDPRISLELIENLQGSLPAISLPSQVSINSIFVNNVEPSFNYAQLVYGYAKEDDLLICLSTSRNSGNVVNTARVTKCLRIEVLALTGKNESKLSATADIKIMVPETESYRIQELHLPIYHYLCTEVEEEFFK